MLRVVYRYSHNNRRVLGEQPKNGNQHVPRVPDDGDGRWTAAHGPSADPAVRATNGRRLARRAERRFGTAGRLRRAGHPVYRLLDWIRGRATVPGLSGDRGRSYRRTSGHGCATHVCRLVPLRVVVRPRRSPTDHATTAVRLISRQGDCRQNPQVWCAWNFPSTDSGIATTLGLGQQPPMHCQFFLS